MADTNTKVKIKFKVSSDLYLKMEIYELYFEKEYKGARIDFDKEYIVLDSTLDEFNEDDLRELEKQALILYLGLLVIETERRWDQADRAKRELARSSFEWLDVESDAERMSSLVHQHSKSLHDVYGIMYDIWMYTE